MKTDFLVVGSGLAGLNYILQVSKIHPTKRIVVITKSSTEESNTNLAQGGIAIVQKSTDSVAKHVQDTLKAGDGLCDEETVKKAIANSPSVLAELIEFGVQFDKNEQGEYDLGREGGHSENRIVHHKDNTGKEIDRCLIEQVKKLKNVELLHHHFAIDLLTRDNECQGIEVLNEVTGEEFTIHAKITFLATGGVGQVYSSTTNPLVTTGDGIAMALRANIALSDMEFIQFHPTALFEKDATPNFLVSEAVRGHGAHLCHEDGAKFMYNYDELGSLACRDIVSRAINSELNSINSDHVYLNCTGFQPDEFAEYFPNISEKCHSIGIDPQKEFIPVSPTQHYLCGGITTDEWGQVALKHLFVAGECARTGLHGANRLASNSLLEAYVFSKNCAIKSSEIIDEIGPITEPSTPQITENTSKIETAILGKLRSKIQAIMWNHVGIVRSKRSLNKATEELQLLSNEIEFIYQRSSRSVQLCELRNISAVACAITDHSVRRTENRGGYFNSDFI